MPRLLALVVLLVVTSSNFAAEPWQLNGWSHRAIVEIPQPVNELGGDVAGVKVLCRGLGKADGSDYRVVDASGKSVPFQLAFHDPAHYSLLTFQCVDPKQKFFVYFGNPQATKAPEMSVADRTPGSGPPKGAWVPKYGFVLETMARPKAADIEKEKNPETVEDMAKLIAGSTRPHGAKYVRNVSDGYNQFGPSEYYISVYRGWIRIPKAGKYRFCTASNEASFSFMDGKPLIHWPGRHTAARGERGEFNAMVELTEGLHYLEYYHEEVTLEQMAFLGWRESGDEGMFSPIPDAVFTAPHPAIVSRYEDTKGPFIAFEPTITDSIWPIERSEGQYTRATFEVPKSGSIDGATYRWDFGDGQSATGAKVEHVYLNTGDYIVTLTTGTQTIKWPLEVFEIEHVTPQFREGRPKDYAVIAKGYDRSKLSEAGLRELANLLAESDEPAEAVKAGDDFVKRFPNAPPLSMANVRRLMAECSLRLGTGGIDDAITNYQAAIVKEMPAREKLEVLRKLIQLVGLERKQPDKAMAVLKQVDEVFKTNRLDADGLKAYRQAIIAGGDVQLWQGNADEAMILYRRAEQMRGQPIPSQVRAAKIGSYPNSLQEYIDSGNYGAAIDLVEQWEETFPTDKVNGQSFYWRGKLLLLRGQSRDAIRYLTRSIVVTLGANYETEARWLLGLALEQSNQPEAAKTEWAKLLKIGFDDEFVKKAREKLTPKK